MTSGSISPVGRTTCSTTCVDISSSYGARRGRHEHDLVDPLAELLEPQRPVVHRPRQPEAVLDERVLARPVALVLAVELRHGLVPLVEDDEEVLRGSSRAACTAARPRPDRRGACE